MYVSIKIASRYLCELLQSEEIDEENLRRILLCLRKRKIEGLSQMRRRINIIIEWNIIPKLVGFLQHLDSQIANNSIIILGDISSIASSACLIQNNIVDKGCILLFSSQMNLRKKICFIFSNIAADSLEMALQLLGNHLLIENLLFLFQNDVIDVGIKIGYVFANLLIHRIDKEFVKTLFQKCRICLFYVELMLKCEQQNNSQFLNDVLISMGLLLNGSKKFFTNQENDDIDKKLCNLNIRPILERFMTLSSPDVKNSAEKILIKHFDRPPSIGLENS